MPPNSKIFFSSYPSAVNKNKRKFLEFQRETVGHASGVSVLTTCCVCQIELVNVQQYEYKSMWDITL